MIIEKEKQRYEQNREKIKEYRCQKFDCDCGGKYTRGNKIQHQKTLTHKQYIQDTNQPIEINQ